MTEFFDTGYSRTLPWVRRPQAAAMVAALADPDRSRNAIVIGEYERAFYLGSADDLDAWCTKPWFELGKQGCTW